MEGFRVGAPSQEWGGRDGKTSFHERRLGLGNQVVQCDEGRGLAGGLARGVRGRRHHWVIDKDILRERNVSWALEPLSRFKL